MYFKIHVNCISVTKYKLLLLNLNILNTLQTRMRGRAQPDGRPAVELIQTLIRLSLIPTRATQLFD